MKKIVLVFVLLMSLSNVGCGSTSGAINPAAPQITQKSTILEFRFENAKMVITQPEAKVTLETIDDNGPYLKIVFHTDRNGRLILSEGNPIEDQSRLYWMEVEKDGQIRTYTVHIGVKIEEA